MTKTQEIYEALRAKKNQSEDDSLFDGIEVEDEDPFSFGADLPSEYVDPNLPPLASSSGSSAGAVNSSTNTSIPNDDFEARRGRREKRNSVLRRPYAPPEPANHHQLYTGPSAESIQDSSAASSTIDKSYEDSLVSTEDSSTADEEWEEDENELTRFTDMDVSLEQGANPGTVELSWGGKMPRLARIRHDVRKRCVVPSNSIVIDDEDVDDEASVAVLSIKSTRSKKSVIDEGGAASVHTAKSSRSVRSRISRLSQRLRGNKSDRSTSSRRSWFGLFRKCNDTACGPGREHRGPQIGDTIVFVESKHGSGDTKRKSALASLFTKKRKKENPQTGEDEYEEVSLFQDLIDTFTEPAYFFQCVGESANLNANNNGCFPDSTFDCIDSMTPCRPGFGRKKRVNKRDDIVLSP